MKTLKNKESIKAITEAHQGIIDKYKANPKIANSNHNYDYDPYYSENDYYIDLTYNLKNGSTIKRNYRISFEDYNKLSVIDLSDEYIDAIGEMFEKSYEQSVKYNQPCQLYLTSEYFEQDLFYGEGYHIKGFDFSTKSQYIKLADVIKLDLKKLTLEEYLTPSEKVVCLIEINGSHIPIYENYTNTLNHLKTLGYDFSDIKLDYEFSESPTADSMSFLIKKADDFKEFGCKIGEVKYYPVCENNRNQQWWEPEYDNIMPKNNYTLTDDDQKNLNIILQNKQLNYYSNEDIYLIIIDGHTMYAIPAKYNDIAEKYADSKIYYNYGEE